MLNLNSTYSVTALSEDLVQLFYRLQWGFLKLVDCVVSWLCIESKASPLYLGSIESSHPGQGELKPYS